MFCTCLGSFVATAFSCQEESHRDCGGTIKA